MQATTLELRVSALEAEITRVKEQLARTAPAQGDWLDEIFGVLDHDPIYEEAMRLGREYRESLRPKAVRKPARKATKKTAKGRKH